MCPRNVNLLIHKAREALIHRNNHTWFFPNFERTLGSKQRSLTQMSSLSTKPVFVPSISEVHVCMCVRVQSYMYVHNVQHSWKALWPKCVDQIWPSVTLELQSNSRYSTHTSSLWTKPESSRVDAIFCMFHKRSTCMYVCTCAVSHGH